MTAASPLEVEPEADGVDGIPEEVEAVLDRLEAQNDPAPLAKPNGPQDVDLDKIARIAKAMVASGYFQDVRSVAQSAVKILAGAELGMGAFASMSGIYVVQGRVTLSAQMMASLIKRSGKYDYRVREWDRQHAKLEFFQRIDGTWESIGFSEYSVDDAKRAGLIRQGRNGPSTWEAHPDVMTFARALSRGARWLCADAITGPVYVTEELDDTAD